MIAFSIGLLARLVSALNREQDAFTKGYEDMTAKITYLCAPHAEYDPATVFKARAELIGAYHGRDKDFRKYQEGIREATTVYEREFGAP